MQGRCVGVKIPPAGLAAGQVALWLAGALILQGLTGGAQGAPAAGIDLVPGQAIGGPTRQNLAPVVGVDAEQISCFMGGSASGKIVNAQAMASQLKGLTEYRLYNLNGDAGAAVAPAPPVDEGSDGECADLWRHDLALDPRSAGKFFAALRPAGTGVSPLPETLQSLDAPRPEHIELVRKFLLRRNVANPEVKIIQTIRTDLDGDGIDDWILNAVRQEPDRARKGDYSILLVLRGQQNGFRTYIIQDDVTLEDSPYTSTLWVNTVVAVVDVDGDGAMEIILNGAYIYGGGWDLIRFQDGGFEYVLFCGCDG